MAENLIMQAMGGNLSPGAAPILPQQTNTPSSHQGAGQRVSSQTHQGRRSSSTASSTSGTVPHLPKTTSQPTLPFTPPTPPSEPQLISLLDDSPLISFDDSQPQSLPMPSSNPPPSTTQNLMDGLGFDPFNMGGGTLPPQSQPVLTLTPTSLGSFTLGQQEENNQFLSLPSTSAAPAPPPPPPPAVPAPNQTQTKTNEQIMSLFQSPPLPVSSTNPFVDPGAQTPPPVSDNQPDPVNSLAAQLRQFQLKKTNSTLLPSQQGTTVPVPPVVPSVPPVSTVGASQSATPSPPTMTGTTVPPGTGSIVQTMAAQLQQGSLTPFNPPSSPPTNVTPDVTPIVNQSVPSPAPSQAVPEPSQLHSDVNLQLALDVPTITQRVQAIPERLLTRLLFTDFNNVAKSERGRGATTRLDADTELMIAKAGNLWWGFLHFLELIEYNRTTNGAEPDIPLLSHYLLNLFLSINVLLEPQTFDNYDLAYNYVFTDDFLTRDFDTQTHGELFRKDATTLSFEITRFQANQFDGLVRIHQNFVNYLSTHTDADARDLATQIANHPLLEMRREAKFLNDEQQTYKKWISFDPPKFWRASEAMPNPIPQTSVTDKMTIATYPADQMIPAMRYLIQMALSRKASNETAIDISTDFRLMMEFLIRPFLNERQNSMNIMTTFLMMALGDYPILFRDTPFGEGNYHLLGEYNLLRTRISAGADKLYDVIMQDPLEMEATLLYPKENQQADVEYTATLQVQNPALERGIIANHKKNFGAFQTKIQNLSATLSSPE
ncbi:hypothetical protein [Parendozoicomonas haliclonae]|uniref:hypothetical protein n=2 Tax=Parendozoicomonas haliclonae TaxID=1960125 RepID=UPI0039F07964